MRRQVSIAVLGVCWLALFVDAWRLGRPPTLFRKHRLVALGVSLSLMTGVATPLAYGAHLLKIQQGVLTDIFVNGGIGAGVANVRVVDLVFDVVLHVRA